MRIFTTINIYCTKNFDKVLSCTLVNIDNKLSVNFLVHFSMIYRGFYKDYNIILNLRDFMAVHKLHKAIDGRDSLQS